MEPDQETRKRIDDNYSYYERKEGSGSFGTVYKGFSKKHNSFVALKKLNADGAR